ncbi:MAG: DNA repair protein RecO [Ignavibacteriae bacterium]|nr:DNA repair protein RecO [Ignavibacteria bacterium]MBI3365459.1 DNA repair protein RecO [Ignavibacteriota bacterium]
MSEIIKTEAIVLKSMKYRETSKIVTLYTREFGKVSTIVKGARRAKSTFGSSLEPMSYVSVVFYKKQGRELQTLAQCDVITPFRKLAEDLEKMSVGVTIIELVSAVAHEEERNVALFNLVATSLTTLNDVGKNSLNLLYAFEVHLARILGFQPTFGRCISCGRPLSSQLSPDDEIVFHLDRGGPLCGNCANTGGQAFLLSRGSLINLQRIASAEHLVDVSSVDISKESKAEIGNFLWSYLRYHVSGIRTLRSEKVFAKILTVS